MIDRNHFLHRVGRHWRDSLGGLLAIGLATWLLMGSSSEAQFKEKAAPQFPRRPGRGVPAQPAGNAANTFWCAVFSPDGRTLAAVGGAQETPGKLMVWDLPKARIKFQANEAKGIRSLTYSPDGRTLALTPYNRKVKLHDASTMTAQMLSA